MSLRFLDTGNPNAEHPQRNIASITCNFKFVLPKPCLFVELPQGDGLDFKRQFLKVKASVKDIIEK